MTSDAAEPTSTDAPPSEGHAGPGGDGVDVSLIEWMLRLSPDERLRAAQDMVDTVWALRHGR